MAKEIVYWLFGIDVYVCYTRYLGDFTQCKPRRLGFMVLRVCTTRYSYCVMYCNRGNTQLLFGLFDKPLFSESKCIKMYIYSAVVLTIEGIREATPSKND